MTDQPKPTTGEQISGEDAGNSDAPQISLGISRTDALKPSPEPATDEWTVERIERYRNKAWLANDINAALDAAIAAARKDAADQTERACEQRQANSIAAAQQPLVDASNGLLEALATKDSWGKEVDSLYAALAKLKEGK